MESSSCGQDNPCTRGNKVHPFSFPAIGDRGRPRRVSSDESDESDKSDLSDLSDTSRSHPKHESPYSAAIRPKDALAEASGAGVWAEAPPESPGSPANPASAYTNAACQLMAISLVR